MNLTAIPFDMHGRSLAEAMRLTVTPYPKIMRHRPVVRRDHAPLRMGFVWLGVPAIVTDLG